VASPAVLGRIRTALGSEPVLDLGDDALRFHTQVIARKRTFAEYLSGADLRFGMERPSPYAAPGERPALGAGMGVDLLGLAGSAVRAFRAMRQEREARQIRERIDRELEAIGAQRRVRRRRRRKRSHAIVALHTAPTSALPPAFLRDLRTMLDRAFLDDFSDEDWAHTIGGTHVWVSEGDDVVSHGSLIDRTVECAGHELAVGYVEAVATVVEHRHRGHGTTVMQCLGALIREHHVLGVLSTGVPGFYERCGWERWRGPTYVNGPTGRTRTPADDGDIMVLRTARSPELDFAGDIVCNWRAGDVW
jgi:aminoglycoside 2'-N-acetyltransferase I